MDSQCNASHFFCSIKDKPTGAEDGDEGEDEDKDEDDEDKDDDSSIELYEDRGKDDLAIVPHDEWVLWIDRTRSPTFQPMKQYVEGQEHLECLYMFYYLLCVKDCESEDERLTEVDNLLANESCFLQCNNDRLGNNLYLLPGTRKFQQLDHCMSASLKKLKDKKFKESGRLMGFLPYLFHKLVEYHGFDFIILDVGPSDNTMNMLAVLSSDYVIPPVNASMFSCSSVHGLLTRVFLGEGDKEDNDDANVGWFKEAVEIRKLQKAVDIKYPFLLKKKKPKMLPFLVNNYSMVRTKVPLKINKNEKRKNKTGFQEFVQQPESSFILTMNSFVKEDIVQKKKGIEFVRFSSDGDYVVPFLRSMPYCLGPCEEFGRSIVELEENDIEDYYGSAKEMNALLPTSKKYRNSKYKEGSIFYSCDMEKHHGMRAFFALSDFIINELANDGDEDSYHAKKKKSPKKSAKKCEETPSAKRSKSNS